jgi:hypothetical protein
MVPFSCWRWYFRQYGRSEPLVQDSTPLSFVWGLRKHKPWDIPSMDPDYAMALARDMKHREMLWPRTPLCGQRALYDFSWVGKAEELARQKGYYSPVVVEVGRGQGQLVIDLIKETGGSARSSACCRFDVRFLQTRGAGLIYPV